MIDETRAGFRGSIRGVDARASLGYAVHNPFAGGPAKFLKYDFKRGTTEVHSLEGDRAPSEGVFVPVGAGEDDGYVLAPVTTPRVTAVRSTSSTRSSGRASQSR